MRLPRLWLLLPCAVMISAAACTDSPTTSADVSAPRTTTLQADTTIVVLPDLHDDTELQSDITCAQDGPGVSGSGTRAECPSNP